MRLVDTLFRSGHLSDQGLVEAWQTGNRPAHLDQCELCLDRTVELTRWLDEVRHIAVAEADAAFPPERLAAQQAQILRRLEQPGSSRSRTRARHSTTSRPGRIGTAGSSPLPPPDSSSGS